MKLNNILLCVFILSIAGTAWGQECEVTASPVSFGKYDALSGAPLDATGEVNVTCDTDLPFTVKLDQGENSGGSFHPRMLEITAGSESLQYNLYRDSARQEIWGDGTGNTFVNTGTGTGSEIPLTVYGRITARQKGRVELYQDLINVLVEW